ncbi:MAG: hypothetical protein ACOCVF_03860, partial [bacterium]
MVISTFGKKFLRKYNEENNTEMSVEDFFYDIFYPKILGNDKLGVMINNSPFFQNYIVKLSKLKKKGKLTKENIQECKKLSLDCFKEKIEKKEFDGCMYVGWGATESSAKTSGQLTNIDFDIDKNEIYYSWIAHALSLDINEYNVLINNDQVLYDIFLGWDRFKDLLNDNVLNMKQYEISSWNSYWVSNFYDQSGQEDEMFNPFINDDYNRDINGNAFLYSKKWINILHTLCVEFGSAKQLWYVYKLDKDNETYGYIGIKLNEINSFISMCKTYFGENEFLKNRNKFETLFGGAFGFSEVCEFGQIGISEIKPEVLKLEMERNNKAKYKYKKIFNDDYGDYLIKLYKLYIMSILNIANLDEKINQLIELMVDIETSKMTKSTGKQTIVKFLLSKNRSTFINNLTELSKARSIIDNDGAIIKEFWEICYSIQEKNIPELMAN